MGFLFKCPFHTEQGISYVSCHLDNMSSDCLKLYDFRHCFDSNEHRGACRGIHSDSPFR